MLFDSHCHLNFDAFAGEWRAVIADCQAQDVWLMNVGAQLETSQQAVAITSEYQRGVYASVGLHPIHVEGGAFHPEPFDSDQYRTLIASSPLVAAIGETGIDFFHDAGNFTKQRAVFIEHINLAKELGKALIVHSRNSRDGSRNAYQEILTILKKEQPPRGVIHCFGGTRPEAEAFLALGFYVGFTGIVTFKNARPLAGVVAALPLERIVIETDAPYLAPEPHRGEENTPQYVRFVAQKIADIKGLSFDPVANQTSQNAINLYNLA